MSSKQRLKNIDKTIIVLVFLLSIIGLIAISSATGANISGDYSKIIVQAVWMVFGFASMFIIALFNFNMIDENLRNILAIAMYILNITLLIAVLIFGYEVNGAVRWMRIGPFNFQPSEFAKLIMIFCMAAFLSLQDDNINNPIYLLMNIALVFLPIIFILKQPNLSTSIVFVLIFLAQLFVARLDYRYILWGLALLIPVLLGFLWYIKRPDQKLLEDYQKIRILAALSPGDYANKEAYQTIKSVQAIGSGRLYGKGIYQGILNKAKYLPEPQTDFIFSIIAEEVGFLGCSAILLIYFVLIVKGILLVRNIDDIFIKLVVTGIIAMIFFQVFINVGVVTGILPNTGLTLPFISYGGSSFLMNMMAIGFLLNIGIKKKQSYRY